MLKWLVAESRDRVRVKCACMKGSAAERRSRPRALGVSYREMYHLGCDRLPRDFQMGEADR